MLRTVLDASYGPSSPLAVTLPRYGGWPISLAREREALQTGAAAGILRRFLPECDGCDAIWRSWDATHGITIRGSSEALP